MNSFEQLGEDYQKGRGAQINPSNRFDKLSYESELDITPLETETRRTEYIEVYPKTMINNVASPDLPMNWSVNPYQGCEHGCVYCYARNTHNYWGYSAGTDFETKILVKKNAAKLVEEKIKSKNWKASPIMLSGNTDCYQPIERKLEITRGILEVLWRHRHPVSIITKNSLVLRDLDLLKKMADNRLVRVAISVTTLDEDLRRRLEPRTASVHSRLFTIEKLASNGIPVSVMFAPIIPGLNDHEIFKLAEYTSGLGALSFGYTVVRLNGDIGAIFEDWVRKNLPDRADKVLNRIKDLHGGQLGDSRFGDRMRGQGNFAEIIRSQVQLARRKFFAGREAPPFNLDMFEELRHPQLSLF
ncbi:MAG: PA0069 family radical SAM protein [Saprospiraceae bacterium]|nr:PA0069 family radical SAM protein [Saprospiraceae bacterium]